MTSSCSGDNLTEHFSLSNSLNMSGMAPPLLLLPSLSISCSSPVNQAAPLILLCWFWYSKLTQFFHLKRIWWGVFCCCSHSFCAGVVSSSSSVNSLRGRAWSGSSGSRGPLARLYIYLLKQYFIKSSWQYCQITSMFDFRLLILLFLKFKHAENLSKFFEKSCRVRAFLQSYQHLFTEK